MGLTHDELLAKIDDELIKYGQRGNVVKHSFALRAVMELHYPKSTGIGFTDLICGECSGLDANDYPCATIRAIEKELE